MAPAFLLAITRARATAAARLGASPASSTTRSPSSAPDGEGDMIGGVCHDPDLPVVLRPLDRLPLSPFRPFASTRLQHLLT